MGSIVFLDEVYEMKVKPRNLLKNSIAKRNIEEEIINITDEIAENNREEIDKIKTGVIKQTVLEAKIIDLIDKKQLVYEGLTRNGIIKIILDQIFGYYILQKYIEDPAVNDIMVNSYDNIWIRKGLTDIKVSERFRDEDTYQKFLIKICAFIGEKINGSSPQADGTDKRFNLRISITQSPINTYSPSLIIRKSHRNVTDEEVFSDEIYPEELLQSLDFMQKAGSRVIFSGPLESGKTTALNKYLNKIKNERIVIMEDTPEMIIDNENCIYKRTVLDKNNQAVRVTLADLVRDFKRTNGTMPVVSEVRGIESVELLDVFNAGFKQGATSIHANSDKDVIRQLVFQIKASGKLGTDRAEIEEYISRTLDHIIYMEKRKIVCISEVGYDYEKREITLSPLHEFEIESETKDEIIGHFNTCINPYSPKMVDRIRRAGLKNEIPNNMLPVKQKED